ncbi:phospholipid carrier-dependent glycosyltransferase [archaeon]|nr:MAG: phospholipid carrier-dependent glycosyltransferase [archaeon]
MPKGASGAASSARRRKVSRTPGHDAAAASSESPLASSPVRQPAFPRVSIDDVEGRSAGAAAAPAASSPERQQRVDDAASTAGAGALPEASSTLATTVSATAAQAPLNEENDVYSMSKGKVSVVQPVNLILGRWTYTEVLAPVLIFALAAFTRLYRLDKPGGVVFDEHHFGRFTNQYNAGTYLFDIHPPLGKLTLYAVSRMVGYEHSVCNYTKIDDAYHPDCLYLWLRFTSALIGSLTAPLMYTIARTWGASMFGSAFVAILFIFDGLNLGESRLILIDAQVIFWAAACLQGALLWWQAWNAHRAAELAGPAALAKSPLAGARRWLWDIGMGVLCGNSVSVKFTGLATPGMVAVESFFAPFFLHQSIPFIDLIVIALTSAATFSTYYYFHFLLLPLTGDGDEFMFEEFKKTLVGNPLYDPEAPKPGFWYSLYYVRRLADAAHRARRNTSTVVAMCACDC